jgi:hypothetical protein
MVAGMMPTRQLTRIAKILVETEGIDYPTAEARLKRLTLEIEVGREATSPAAHAAVLTAVSVGRRTFVGGVRVVGETSQPLNSALPIKGASLGEATSQLGAAHFHGTPLQRVVIGKPSLVTDPSAIAAWWNGWRAGTSRAENVALGAADNPLAGIAAGGLTVGAAFQAARGARVEINAELDLWVGETAPDFAEVYLPGALWLLGLGNLGQAYLWALASLPYENPADVELVLQDRDQVTEENWATSVLVQEESYGVLKTKTGELFCDARGFKVRRVDRFLLAGDRLEDGDPRIALSGVDKVAARRLMADVGFDCIVDAGLGRTAKRFDHFRVSIFDRSCPIDKHFADVKDEPQTPPACARGAYDKLEADIGRCGAAEIAGASAAVPHVSAVTAAIAVSRLVKLVSGQSALASEVGRLSELSARRRSDSKLFETRGARHAGRPRPLPAEPTP